MGAAMRKLTMLAFLSAVFSFASPTAKLPLPHELQGEQVPHFFVLAPDNKSELYKHNIKEEAKKAGAKRVVLSFFATHCKYCWEEFEILKKNENELKKRGVRIYLINVGESIHEVGGKVKTLVEKHAGKSFPYYFDPSATLHEDFGLPKQGEDFVLPLTLILDSDMRVLSILVGKMGDDFPQILWEGL